MAARASSFALDPSELASLGVVRGTGAFASAESSKETLPIDWPELERLLPGGGLSRGVVEIASAVSLARASSRAPLFTMRGGASTLALAAIRAAHASVAGGISRAQHGDPQAWCAWISPEGAPSLYAPAVAQAGVDLDRLLVVRPPVEALARTAVKVATSAAFEVVVIDATSPSGLDGRVPGMLARMIASDVGERPPSTHPTRPRSPSPRARVPGAVVVRRLALASEETGTSFLVLSNIYASRAVPWPVAMRLEVERRPDALSVRVTKDRRGLAASSHVVRVAC